MAGTIRDLARERRARGPIPGASLRGTGVLLGALAAIALVGPTGRAAATHEPDHRFVVIGFVTDARGHPAADSPVVVTRRKTGLVHRVRTERDGFYLVVLHLHDEDEGERLSVTASGVALEVQARFDPEDRRVERGTRVDVRGGEAFEDRAAFAETLRRYLSR